MLVGLKRHFDRVRKGSQEPSEISMGAFAARIFFVAAAQICFPAVVYTMNAALVAIGEENSYEGSYATGVLADSIFDVMHKVWLSSESLHLKRKQYSMLFRWGVLRAKSLNL